MKKGKHPFFNIMMTVVLFLFILTAAVSLVIYFRPLYYIVIKLMKIPEKTGYSFEVCRRNYNILIDYNLLFGPKKLEFMDFPMSVKGTIHFAEVKDIFVAIQITAISTMVLTVAGYLYSKKIRDYKWLKWTIILAVIVVVTVGGMLAFDWDGTFTLMHELLFDNDYWLFDPNTDPIIYVLPDTFFLACAAMILVFMTLGLVLSGCLYRKHHRGPGKAYPKKTGRKK